MKINIQVDRTNRKVKLSLRGKQVMEELIKKERDHTARLEGCNWHPEFGAWMVESTPSRPYTGCVALMCILSFIGLIGVV